MPSLRLEKADTKRARERAPSDRRPRLDTIVKCRRELARLYYEGKAGRRDVQDVSRLANVVALIARIIEQTELEKRIETIEGRMRRADG